MFIRILKMEPTFPVTVSAAAVDCIKGLLKVNEQERLGSSEAGAADIIKTTFFSVYNFEALYRKEVVPPFKPDVRNELDTKYVPAVYLQESAMDSFGAPTTSNPLSASVKGSAKFDQFAYEGDEEKR